MKYPSQDDALRRVLAYFGLRSITSPHDYEATVIPTVSVGDLGQVQSAITRTSINVVSNLADFPAPPAGESWRILAFGGLYTQAAGAVAGNLRFTVRDWGSSAATVLLLPFFVDQIAGDVTEDTWHPVTLNTSVRFMGYLRNPFIIGPGQRIAANPGGDGTRTVTDLILLVNKLGGSLSELD